MPRTGAEREQDNTLFTVQSEKMSLHDTSILWHQSLDWSPFIQHPTPDWRPAAGRNRKCSFELKVEYHRCCDVDKLINWCPYLSVQSSAVWLDDHKVLWLYFIIIIRLNIFIIFQCLSKLSVKSVGGQASISITPIISSRICNIPKRYFYNITMSVNTLKYTNQYILFNL